MDHADIDHTGLTGIPTSNGLSTDTLWDAAGDLVVGSGANTAAKLSIGATNGMSLRRVSGAVAWDLPPGHEFDYVAKTSDTSITATTEGGANTVVTASAVAYDGSTAIWLEFDCAGWQIPNVSGGSLLAYLYDDTGGGASSIGLMNVISNPAALSASIVGMRVPGPIKVRLTPSNATHTYSIRCSVTSGTGTIKAGAFGAGTNRPAYIRQFKV